MTIALDINYDGDIDAGEPDCSTELDWDGNSYTGTLTCGGDTYDLHFYFEHDDYENTCYFKLRSDALGYPEGYEYEWEVGYDIDCETLSGQAGVLSFVPVELVTPEDCTGCECLCECVCMTLTQADGTTCTGKLCWDYIQQAYVGTLTCNDYPITTIDVTVTIGRKGDYCEDLYDGNDDGCDPYDDTCVIVLNIPDLGIEYEWQELTNCAGRNLDYTWTVGEVGYTITASITCALCNEECEVFNFEDCPCPDLPRSWDYTVSVLSGPAVTCSPATGTVTLENGITPTWHDGTPGSGGADASVVLQCISRDPSTCLCIGSEGGHTAFGWTVTYLGDGKVPLSQDTCARCSDDPDFGEENPGVCDGSLDLTNGICMCDPQYILSAHSNTLCGGIGDGLIAIEFTPAA